jgi:hypothetical protein
MRTTRLVFGSVVALAASAFVSACAPSGETSVDGGGTFVEPMSLENRDLQFSSHILLTLSDIRRTLDDAQTLFPNTRQQARPGDLYEFGCRNLKKIWPDPESEQPTNNEKFAVLYNCIDGGKNFGRVDLDGADTYNVGYSQPLPKLGEKRERPMASSIMVNGTTVYTSHFRDGLYTANDEVKVTRKTTFNAQVSAQTETDVVFDVDLEVEDNYDFDVSKSFREGRFVTKMLVTASVDKKTHKVKSLSPYFMSVSVNGTQWQKSSADRGAGRSNPVAIKLRDYEFSADGPVRLNPDVCELPDVNLLIKKGSKEPTEVSVASQAGKITIEGVGESQLKACDLTRAADPLFAQVHEGLFF